LEGIAAAMVGGVCKRLQEPVGLLKTTENLLHIGTIAKMAAIPTYGWTTENFEETQRRRGIDLGTYLRRLHHVNTAGLPVRLRVDALDAHSMRNDKLLTIVCHPMRGFTHLASDAKVVASFFRGENYHISLCFLSELRDPSAYERIRYRYNGGTGVLSVKCINSAADLIEGSPLSNELLADQDVKTLHDNGYYKNRPLHVSL
jgi:hypothetical protein